MISEKAYDEHINMRPNAVSRRRNESYMTLTRERGYRGWREGVHAVVLDILSAPAQLLGLHAAAALPADGVDSQRNECVAPTDPQTWQGQRIDVRCGVRCAHSAHQLMAAVAS